MIETELQIPFKMKLQIIQLQMEAIVKTLFFLVLTLIVSCNSKKSFIEERYPEYSLINSIGYDNHILNRVTLSYDNLSNKNLFTINEINKRNYKDNWVFENKPFVNFDTIFNSTQENKINEKFKKLESIYLNKNKIKNKNALSKKGQTYITYPFFQEGKKGKIYAFFFSYLLLYFLISI